MRFLIRLIIKLGLLAVLVCFALINYRFLSLDKGWSIVEINNNDTVSTVASLITSPPTKIEYYKKTISTNEYDYKVHIVTKDNNYLFDATEQDIQTLDFLGIFANNIKPEKITPIPFYVEIVLGVIILIIPFGRKSKS